MKTDAAGFPNGQRQSLRPVLHPHHGGIAAGALHGIAEDDVIVLFPDPTLRAQLGRGDQLLQCRRRTLLAINSQSGKHQQQGHAQSADKDQARAY